MINEIKLSQYYSEIANKLDEIIPIEWETIVMYAEELSDVSSASFYFYAKEGNEIYYSGNIPEDFSVSREIFKRILRELREIIRRLWNEFVSSEEEKWSRLTFVLQEDWKFKAKFGYDLDTKVGSFERKVIWAYNELGLIPKGEFAKEILKEYLNKQKEEL